MYLKRLDVQGFKSFAGRTSFEFGQGITAIVGPNGSGKSNIADALRWVLGEQSGRLLRAKKLDDIIYAGSGKRPRGDKVEVTSTLDNSDGWLPLDVGEVGVARRGYRSGESDYIINRKKVRLREIQTLLAKASATQNSYAIIGQGLVESVLNLRAEERRQLIEEAADIQRYRLKIEEAESRLAGTHENVERVKLLMKEIAPRVSQLERQAKRAGEHSRLSQELTQGSTGVLRAPVAPGAGSVDGGKSRQRPGAGRFHAGQGCAGDVPARAGRHNEAIGRAAANSGRRDGGARPLERTNAGRGAAAGCRARAARDPAGAPERTAGRGARRRGRARSGGGCRWRRG